LHLNGIIIVNRNLHQSISNMKHLYFTILILASFFTINAQNDNQHNSTNFNEVKLNGLYLVLGTFEVTYERTLSEESAVGISVFLPFDDDISNDIEYYISPYYRFYFGKKYAAGFFFEGFGMLNSTQRNDVFISNQNNYVTDFALGIGLGGKWVTNSGFIGELSFGIGRNLFNSSETDDDLVAKLGITLGYRF